MDLSDDQIASILSRGDDSSEEAPDGAVDLRTFSAQLIAIAQALRKEDLSELNKLVAEQGLSKRRSALPDNNSETGEVAIPRKRYVEMARSAYATRRKRTGIFGTIEIFGEPAWDILLDLYIAHGESKAVSVSSACIGSASPPTTGLRWLGVLTDHNFITREHDPDDQRRILVRLTDRALQCMDTYFASAA